MKNIDHVILGLDYCCGDSLYCKLCPYDNHTFCKYTLLKDASTLLKQYRAIKPLIDDISQQIHETTSMFRKE